jgi:hypothetical protein
MKLQGRIPVEPLEEERLVNIERRIVANAKIGPSVAASRRGLFVSGARLAAAAAALVAWNLRGTDVRIVPPPAQHFAITDGTLALDDAGAKIAATPGTSYDVTRDGTKVIINMSKGTVDLAVEHREGRLLVVRAGDTDIEDVGTKFSVAWDGVGDVDVRVREGEVKVRHGRQEVLVAKGQEWKPSGVIALVEEAVKPAEPVVAVAPVVVASKEPELHEHHAAVPPPPPVHHVDKTESAPVMGEPIAPPSAHPTVVAPSDPYVDLKQAIKKQPLVDDPRVDGQGDAAAEIARLKKIAYSPTASQEASQALYRIALLLHKPLHQDAEALRTIDVYLRRFRAGKELGGVLWLRVRIECGRSIDQECRQAAYSYQHAVPNGDLAEVAIRITNAQ